MLMVAIDIEGCASTVVDQAAAMARDLGEPTLLTTVIERPDGVAWGAPLGGDLAGKTVLEAMETDANVALQELARLFITPVETRVVHGKTVQAVIELAKEVDPRILVLGTHGRRGLSRMFLGSVAESIIRQSQWPVFVVPAGDFTAHRSVVRETIAAESVG